MKTFRTQYPRGDEWACRFYRGGLEFRIIFFVERTPREIEIHRSTIQNIRVETLDSEYDGELVPLSYTVTADTHGNDRVTRILINDPKPTTSLRVSLAADSLVPDYEVLVSVRRERREDRTHLERAHQWIGFHEWEKAKEELHAYEEFSKNNPWVCQLLGQCYRRLEKTDRAEYYFLKTVANGVAEGRNQYEALQRQRSPLDVERIRELQKESADWSLGSQHGLVVLEKNQRFRLEIDGFHLRTCREVIEIRRRAAARMLRTMQFPFSATKEYLLYTNLRIIHPGDEIEEVSSENFTVSDGREKNIFIMVEDERSGNWIMPDLMPGDVVDWTVHFLTQESHIKEKPHCYVFTSLFNEQLPTYRAASKFIAPKKWPGDFSCQHTRDACVEEKKEDKDVQVFTYSGRRYVPTKHTGFPYENNFLNPLVVCSGHGPGWPEVAAEVAERSFGSMDTEDEIPGPIREVMQQGEDRRKKLELAYYWVRDKLKYASLMSAHEHIGRSIRAQEIVKAGTGDCKDKGYLLALVCRELGIPFEFIAISADHGILVEKHPANQFDHVFLRARFDDDWIYLDAANHLSPFGNAPAWCQGLKALVLDDEGTIITIPIDDAAANAFRLTETFHGVRGMWLEGEFDLQATGHAGRVFDDRWKSISLAMDNQEQAAQEALKVCMPLVQIDEFSRRSDTSASARLHVSGKHRRCPVVSLGRSRSRIGRLSWDMPSLPTGYWRSLQLDRMLVVDYPVEAVFEVVLKGDAKGTAVDVSRVQGLSNTFCRIAEELIESSQSTRLRRTIAFRERFVEGDEVRDLPATMERIEQALQCVVSFAEVG